MSEITPERADRALDRAVDFTQFLAWLTTIVGVLSGAQLVIDGGDGPARWAGWAVGAGALLAGTVAFLLACWARAWMLRRS